MCLGVKFEVAIEQIDESDQLSRDQKQSKFQLDQEQAKNQDQAEADNHEQYLRHYFPSLQKQIKHLF